MKQFISILFLLSFALLSCKQELPEPPEYTITCYAAVYAKGIFKTDNGGKSWYSIILSEYIRIRLTGTPFLLQQQAPGSSGWT
ncbi:MAG: hypothetical protein JRI96_18275 [Deltaproteobacteria bacterium]|nr:hypothetical protein [Deltaproteobacteria bacterium]